MDEMYLWFAFGIIIGTIMANVLRLVRTSFGTLKIDCSDPDKDVYSIEIDDLDKLAKKKLVLLKVVRTAIFAQK